MPNNCRDSKSLSLVHESIVPPFSNFRFLRSHPYFNGNSPLKRFFSLARLFEGEFILVEEVEPQGSVVSEIEELKKQNIHFEKLFRISFWIGEFTDVSALKNENLLGYLLFKVDSTHPHVYEAVFKNRGIKNNYIPNVSQYDIQVGDKPFEISGILYCQQNGATKSCAHVALRSLLSHWDSSIDYSYEEIHRVSMSISLPSNGLSSDPIRNVLNHYGVNFFDLDYNQVPRGKFPYSKWIYSGIENGYGSLLGFTLSGQEATGGHIIPFFGHTFNQDTWAPRAGNAYFKVGEQTRYFSSEEWMSSFVGHDDNFGPNFCIPRHFIQPQQASYVVSIAPKGVRYDSVRAEVLAISALYNAINLVIKNLQFEFWGKELIQGINARDIVLRAKAVTKQQYLDHLSKVSDREGGRESKENIRLIEGILPSQLWLVEVSVPELFATNFSKLGEIILDAEGEYAKDINENGHLLVHTRVPGYYIINSGEGGRFVHLSTELKSHIKLL